MTKTVDLTYSSELKIVLFGITPKTIDILYTIEGKTEKPTTTSFILDDETMITFDFQQLKKLLNPHDS